MALNEQTELEAKLEELQRKRDSAQEEKQRLGERQESVETLIERIDLYRNAIQERLDALP